MAKMKNLNKLLKEDKNEFEETLKERPAIELPDLQNDFQTNKIKDNTV